MAITKDTNPGGLVVAGPEPSVGQMLQTFLANPESAKNVEVAERMFALWERAEARNAERLFAEAFARVQAEMPRIEADTGVPDKYGAVKYRYARLDDIFALASPIIRKHGFTVTFSSDIKEDRVIQTCTVQHIGGHKRANQYMARIGSGPIHASPAQADGAAATYAKRQAFCDAWMIVVDHDTDGRADAKDEGAPISFEQAAYLKEQVKETGSNEAAFLSYAGATTYEEIGSNRYDSLVRELAKKGKK